VCDDFIAQWKEFLTDNMVEDYEQWLKLLKNDNSQPQIYVRESEAIMRKMNLSAYTARYKVLIMWLPEKLREDAANKLLKLIEEPFDDCKFILVSDNARAVLPTIFSRCQRLELLRPSADVIAHYLVQRYGVDAQDALAVAATADGNINQAEHQLQKNNESAEFLERFIELMRKAYTSDIAALKVWADEVADFKREKTRRFLAYAARQVRENFVLNLHTPGINYMTRNEQAFGQRFSPFINVGNVEQILTELDAADRDILGNGNSRIVLMDMAIKFAIYIKKK